MFSHMRSIHPIIVTTADGSPIICTQQGDITVTAQTHDQQAVQLELLNVLYHQKFAANLISCGQLTADSASHVSFEGQYATIVTTKPRTYIMARKQRNMYVLDATVVISDNTPKANALSLTNAQDLVQMLHLQFGHLPLADMKELARGRVVDGISNAAVKAILNTKELQCEACALGKARRPAFARVRLNDEVSRPLERIHTDLIGPLPVSKYGFCYFSVVMDQWSTCLDARALRFKSEAPQHVRDTIALWERQTGLEVKSLRCDNSRENLTLRSYCADRGIELNLSAPYTPQQNGKMERVFGFLGGRTRAMLTTPNSEQIMQFWPYAYRAATYSINTTHPRRYTMIVNGHEETRTMTPHEALFGERRNVEHLAVFGQNVIVTNGKPTRAKFENPGRRGIFLGYSWETWGKYYVYDLEEKKVLETRDVHFPSELSYTHLQLINAPSTDAASSVLNCPHALWNLYDDEPVSVAVHPEIDVNNEEKQVEVESAVTGNISAPDSAPSAAVELPSSPQEIDLPADNTRRNVRWPKFVYPRPDLPDLDNRIDMKDWLMHNVKGKLNPFLQARIKKEYFNKKGIDWGMLAANANDTMQLINRIWPSDAISGGSHSNQSQEIASAAPNSATNANSNHDDTHVQSADTDNASAVESENDSSNALSAVLRLEHLHSDEQKKYVISTDYGFAGFRAFVLQAKDTAFKPLPSDYDDPKTTAQARVRSDWPQFEAAREKEFAAMEKFRVWTLIPRAQMSADKDPIPLKWVYAIKRDESGQAIKHKARLVAQGFKQIFGLDYTITNAPVMKIESLRLILALAAIYDLEIYQLDIDNAYLNAPLRDAVIYCKQPEGFVVEGKEDHVYVMHKALYGLKQAGYEWNEEFTATLKSLGFTPLASDPCVFRRVTKTHSQIILGVFVDDVIILLHKRDENEWSELKEKIKQRYGIKDIGVCERILGMRIERNRARRLMHVGQEGYIQKVLDVHGMGENERITSKPFPGTKLTLLITPDKTEIVLDEKEKLAYWQIIGALMYAANTTRIDIATAVNQLSRFNARPCEHHYQGAIRVLRYLLGTKSNKLIFDGTVPSIRAPSGIELCESELVSFGDGITAQLSLHGYSDASWAEDLVDGKSTSGYLVKLNNCPIQFKSRVQSAVATAASNAEFFSTAQCMNELVWSQAMLSELNLRNANSPPSRLYCDNASTVTLSQLRLAYTKLKQFALSHAFVRSLQMEQKVIQVVWVPASAQQADGLTKSLEGKSFETFKNTFMGEC